MATVKANVHLHTLFCFKGEDEEMSEPYLWTIVFTIDGRTLTHLPGQVRLTGKPAFFFSPGSHGNLGGGMKSGVTRRIPPALGRFSTTLQPIVLDLLGQKVEVPGQLGVIAVLLEEDMTSDEGAEAAHRAINELVQAEVEEAVAALNIAGIAAEAQPAIAAGTPPAESVVPIFKNEVQLLTRRIERVAKAVAVTAIVEKLSFPGVLLEGADPDEFMGTVTYFFSQSEIEATLHARRLEFVDRIAQPNVHPEASAFNYNLHTHVWQPVEEFFTPVTDQVPPGRWRVTGIARKFSPTHRPFISHLGGTFADGTPWLLEKGQVMRMLRENTHQFFVRGTTRTEAAVFVDPNEEAPNFPFLATVADNDPTNNLAGLPPAPRSVRHLREVAG